MTDDVDPKRIALLRHLVTSGYVPTIENWVKSTCAPFWWHEALDVADERDVRIPRTRANGTISVVDTGSRLIGVSNDHVYQGFLDAIEEEPTLICQIGGARLDPRACIIDRDRRLDLATFDLSAIVVSASGIVPHAPSEWPAGPVEKGAVVILGGWPGHLREERPDEIDAYFASFITQIASSTPDRFGVTLNMRNATPSGAYTLPESPDLGGASGGPVFAILEAPIVSLVLVGFIYEYHQSYEIVLARHSSSVSRDGTLHRT